MVRIAIFYLLQVLASGYAVARGGAPERIVGAGLLVAACASTGLNSGLPVRYLAVEVPILVVDLMLLALLLAVALRADRFWPLWVAALHGLGIGAHLVREFDSGVDRLVYGILLASWSYPIILLLWLGTLRHVSRSRRPSGDLDWTPRARAGDAGSGPA